MLRVTLPILLILISNTLLAQTPWKAESALINGKHIYYEVYGKGSPLFLLHGYTQSSVSWKSYVQDFSASYEVYLVDLPGHGKSDPFKQDLSIRSVAEDLNALINYLELKHIEAIGFSFGGDVLYQLPLINPDLIDRMITIGAVGTWTILDFPQYLESFTFENRADFPWLADSHASDEHIKSMMKQFSNYSIRLSNEELQQIKPEVMIIVGDDDEGMGLKEIVRARKNLPNSDLWILPDVSHGAHEGENKTEFIRRSKLFFSKQ